MSKQFVQNRYKTGDVVCAKVNPTLKLVVRRYIDQVYYCKVQEDPDLKELVYFERELEPLKTQNKLTPTATHLND